MPKIVPKSIQTCFELVLGQMFRKNFSPVFRGGSSLRKFSKKIFSKFQKCPKVFPKVSKRVLNMFGENFSKIFCPVFHGMSSLRKFPKKNIFKIPKMPKSVPKCIQTCFMVIFSKKILCPVFHGGSIFRNFPKFFFSKFQKCPKSFPKVSKRVLNLFWGKLSEKFLPSFPRRVEFSKIFKNKYFQNSKNAQKCSQKYPNVF